MYGGQVAIEYHSFGLTPDLPADYVSSEVDFLQRLYGGHAEAEQRMAVVRTSGARLGLAYHFDNVRHTSTFLAHQLLHHAKANGRRLPRPIRDRRRGRSRTASSAAAVGVQAPQPRVPDPEVGAPGAGRIT